jgi:ATP-dependent RNA helicase HelY
VPLAATRIELPSPYSPRSAAFRSSTVERLKRARLCSDDTGGEVDDREAKLARAVEEHPVATDPQRESRLRAAVSAERLGRDVARLERRVRGRSESLARQFDRVLRVLESWGYVDGWALTEWGEMLARLYTEADLLVAEALREHVLDGLGPADLAALVSCFTYERRGPDGVRPAAPARWPSREVAGRWRTLDELARQLNTNEDDAGLPETRAPDPGFVAYVHDWVSGVELADVLDDDEITGGDFVRHVKQCIDVLRQLGDVAPDPATAAAARAAADEAHRGVISASSVIG